MVLQQIWVEHLMVSVVAFIVTVDSDARQDGKHCQAELSASLNLFNGQVTVISCLLESPHREKMSQGGTS